MNLPVLTVPHSAVIKRGGVLTVHPLLYQRRMLNSSIIIRYMHYTTNTFLTSTSREVQSSMHERTAQKSLVLLRSHCVRLTFSLCSTRPYRQDLFLSSSSGSLLCCGPDRATSGAGILCCCCLSAVSTCNDSQRAGKSNCTTSLITLL